MKTLLIDFDGVLHSYKSGWKGASNIPDPPVPGALDWLKELALSGQFELAIYSARSAQYLGKESMAQWLYEQLKAKYDKSTADLIINKISFPKEKPPAFITIDDRCFCFKGNFKQLTVDKLLSFKSWIDK